MKFLELVNMRESTRKFSNRLVDISIINSCVEAARLAPSACNSQPWVFHIIKDSYKKEKIGQACMQKGLKLNRFVLEAPVLIVITVSKGNIKTKIGQMISGLPYYLIDVGIAAEHFCLQATHEGLATCMIGWFKEKKVKEHLNMSSDERVALILAVGYTKDKTKRKKIRKTLEEITIIYD